MRSPALKTTAALSLFAPFAIAGTSSPKSPVPPAPPAENPLSFAGGRIVFDVENRTRFEWRENNFDFDDSVDALTDDAWMQNRFRLGLLLKPADWLRFYFQGQDAQEMFSDRPDVPGVMGAEGDNPFDLRQAWVEIGDPKKCSWSVKAGRQVLLYGDQRLVGPGDWSALSRSFDAVKLRYDHGDGLWVDAFVSSVVHPDDSGFDESDRDSIFSGIYAHVPGWGPQETEFFLYHLKDDDRNDDFFTLGTHVKSTPEALGPWDYEAGFAFQAGTAGGHDLQACAGYAEVGYTFNQPWKPRVGLEYSYASGDSNAADGDQGAFQNLFPSNHGYYGFMDLFSWSNIHDAVLHLSAAPLPKLTAELDLHAFWLADTSDAWRRANATTAVRPADSSASSFAGAELDFVLTWAVSKNLSLAAGYSHFFAGGYLDDTGAQDDADFVYCFSTIKF